MKSIDFADFKHFEVKAEAIESNEEERAIIHYISTPHRDRGGDIVDPKGMDDSDFAKAPTVFYNHDYALPIAKSLWRKKKEDGIMAKTVFAKTDFANDIYLLHKDGFLNTWSIGWRPKRKDGHLLPNALTFDEGTGTTNINLWELLEYSSAPLPMNPNALDYAKGMVKSAEMQNYLKRIEKDAQVEEVLSYYRDQAKQLDELLLKMSEVIKSVEKIELLEKDVIDLSKSINNESQKMCKEVTNEVEISADKFMEMLSKGFGGEISRIIKSMS